MAQKAGPFQVELYNSAAAVHLAYPCHHQSFSVGAYHDLDRGKTGNVGVAAAYAVKDLIPKVADVAGGDGRSHLLAKGLLPL